MGPDNLYYEINRRMKSTIKKIYKNYTNKSLTNIIIMVELILGNFN